MTLEKLSVDVDVDVVACVDHGSAMPTASASVGWLWWLDGCNEQLQLLGF